MAQLPTSTIQQLDSLLTSSQRIETPQQRFDAAYITAQEIMDRVGVTRPTTLSRMNSRYPVIKIGNTYFWERTPETSAFIDAWETMRKQGE